MPSAVFAMTIASRSSVLASPAKSLAAPCAASPGRYAADIPAALARASARAPMLRDWSTTTSASGKRPNSESVSSSSCSRRGAQQHLAISSRDACPVGRFPDIEPDDGFRHSRWCHGVILQSVGRSEPLPATPTPPAVALAPGSFLSVVRSGERPRWQHPPGPLRGRGRRPSGGARSAAPRGLPVS